MTVIVGLEHGGKVYLGGDIQGTGRNNKVVHTQPKTFNKKGIIFGYTTSYRFGQLLEHALPDPVVPENDAEIYRWLITVLVPSVKAVLKENDYEGGGNCLIGIKSQLWELQNDYSVLRSVKGYGAVGSGYEYATGSVHTSLELTAQLGCTPEPESVIKAAIRAAGTYSPSVGTDSTVIST